MHNRFLPTWMQYKSKELTVTEKAAQQFKRDAIVSLMLVVALFAIRFLAS